MDYVDCTSPVMRMLQAAFSDEIKSFRAYKCESGAALPCLIVRQVSSNTLQLSMIAEGDAKGDVKGDAKGDVKGDIQGDIQAIELLINVGNFLKMNQEAIEGVTMKSIAFQTTPIPDYDEDTEKPGAWCYMRIDYLEN